MFYLLKTQNNRATQILKNCVRALYNSGPTGLKTQYVKIFTFYVKIFTFYVKIFTFYVKMFTFYVKVNKLLDDFQSPFRIFGILRKKSRRFYVKIVS